MERRTVANKIEVDEHGVIGVRFALQTINAAGEIVSQQWHRTAFLPDTDVDEQMKFVNADVTAQDFPACGVDCVARIKAHTVVARTPEVVAAHHKRVAVEVARVEKLFAEAAEQERVRKEARDAKAAQAVKDAVDAAAAEKMKLEKMIAEQVAKQLGEKAK